MPVDGAGEGPFVFQSSEISLAALEGVVFDAAYAYWRTVKGDRWAPPWSAFHLDDLDPTVVPFATVVDVLRDPLDFRYRFWGTGHVRKKNVDCTGKLVSQDPNSRGGVVFEEYRAVYLARVPKAFARTIDIGGTCSVKQFALRLPLTGDGDTVDHIFAVSDWSSFRDAP